MDAWSLIIDGAAQGRPTWRPTRPCWESVAAGRRGPTLRFYQWSPACLSLGVFQKFADWRLPARAAARRGPTDHRRRGDWHDCEWTYSLQLPRNHPGSAPATRTRCIARCTGRLWRAARAGRRVPIAGRRGCNPQPPGGRRRSLDDAPELFAHRPLSRMMPDRQSASTSSGASPEALPPATRRFRHHSRIHWCAGARTGSLFALPAETPTISSPPTGASSWAARGAGWRRPSCSIDPSSWPRRRVRRWRPRLRIGSAAPPTRRRCWIPVGRRRRNPPRAVAGRPRDQRRSRPRRGTGRGQTRPSGLAGGR